MRQGWLVGLLLAGCAGSTSVGALHEVQPGTFRSVVTERGTVGSEQEFQVAAPYSAKIDSLAPEGTLVKPGQVVASLGTESQEDKWERAQLSKRKQALELPLAQNKGTFEAWRLGLEVQNAKLDLRIAKLKFEGLKLGRAGADIVDAAESLGALKAEREILKDTLPEAKALLDKGYLAEDELQRMKTRLGEVEAEMKATRAKLQVLEKGPAKEEIGLERLKVEQAAAALEGAKKRLRAGKVGGKLELEAAKLELTRATDEEKFRKDDVERGTLRTPVAGVVIHNNHWTGAEWAKIKVGDALRDGSVMVTISDPHRQVVKANVDAAAVARLKTGMPVRCLFDAYPGVVAHGKLRTIAPIAANRLEGDLMKVQAIEVQVSLDQADARLKPGMSANLEFVLAEQEQALTVPAEALVKGPAVYVFEAGRLVKRPVKLGAASEREAVVLEGLKAGEQVALKPGEAK
jgi:HlyD family secretion protein